jgi:hypothetical protein
MPYTPPSISPSGLHSLSPAKSSSSYAGLANGYPSSPAEKHSQPRPTPSTHQNYHARPLNHHRRSTGPMSPPRGPIPVTAFAQDRQTPRRPSPVRRPSNSSISSSSDEDDEREPTLNARHLPHHRRAPLTNGSLTKPSSPIIFRLSPTMSGTTRPRVMENRAHLPRRQTQTTALNFHAWSAKSPAKSSNHP